MRDGQRAPADDGPDGVARRKDARVIVLTERMKAMLSARPRGLPKMPVFPNPHTGAERHEVREAFRKAKKAAGFDELWFHDLRRSFITRARKLGVSESVVRMSGHRTRAVFDRYNVVDVEGQRQAVRRLDEAWTRHGHSFERKASGSTGRAANSSESQEKQRARRDSNTGPSA